MALKDKEGNWLNRNGKPVPVKQINKVTKRKDLTVTKIMKKAIKLEVMMSKFKYEIMEEVNKYLKYVENNAGVETNSKGNVVLSDYSGVNQIEISKNDMYEYDEKLIIAKDLIDECLVEWSSDSNINLKAIVSEAFNVDKKGKVNQYMIFRLTKLEINHPTWLKAMELIRQSQDVVGSRQYVSLRRRASPNDKYETINLNFSSI